MGAKTSAAENTTPGSASIRQRNATIGRVEDIDDDAKGGNRAARRRALAEVVSLAQRPRTSSAALAAALANFERRYGGSSTSTFRTTGARGRRIRPRADA